MRAIACVVVAPIVVLSSIFARPSNHVIEGVYRFEASIDVINFPAGVAYLAIDTSKSSLDCAKSQRCVALGGLVVDSIIYLDSSKKATKTSDLANISMKSVTLNKLLADLRITRLSRRMPKSIPGDTLYWSAVQHKYLVESDISTHYSIRLDPSISIQRLDSLFSQIPGLRSHGPISQPIRDTDWIEILPDSVGPGGKR
jgi:hypothetical protein